MDKPSFAEVVARKRWDTEERPEKERGIWTKLVVNREAEETQLGQHNRSTVEVFINFFKLIGNLLGELLFIEDDTLLRKRFDRAKLLIALVKECPRKLKIQDRPRSFLVSIEENTVPVDFKSDSESDRSQRWELDMAEKRESGQSKVSDQTVRVTEVRDGSLTWQKKGWLKSGFRRKEGKMSGNIFSHKRS
ncbi:hypothetical protein QYF36_003990 [Acer negundo]|nr:hypothetical protein QYF36_003990 [Acer negundo]